MCVLFSNYQPSSNCNTYISVILYVYTTQCCMFLYLRVGRRRDGCLAELVPPPPPPPQTWIASLQLLGRANPATVVVSVISILILVGFRLINKGLQRIKVPLPVYSRKERKWCVRRYKWPMALPSQLIIVRETLRLAVTGSSGWGYSVGNGSGGLGRSVSSRVWWIMCLWCCVCLASRW